MKNEIWKDIEGFEGLYQVSNFGMVRSVDHYVTQPNPHNRKPQQVLRPGKLITFSIGSSGYYQAPLSKGNRKYKTMMIHRIVAKTFVPNPDNLEIVNHKDENKLNNRADNLEWCTTKYNAHYGKNTKRTKVQQLDMDGNLIQEFPSARDAAKALESGHRSITESCRKDIPFKGFRWKFKE